VNDLREEIALESAGAKSFETGAFARVFAKRLEEAEQVFNLDIELLKAQGPRNKVLEIMGYAEDDTDNSLVILVGRYFGTDTTLTMTEAKEVLRKGAGFLEHSEDGWIQKNAAISSKESAYAEYFQNKLRKVDLARIRFILITDGLMSDRIKTIDSGELLGIKATYEIWDQARILEASLPDRGSEDIQIDFRQWIPQGLPCLVAGDVDSSTQTLLAVIPGTVLADIFNDYGSLLLESNVRTFLSARGAVNKGIQATLAQEPSKFLAYNNGLTTTASEVGLETTPSGQVITTISRWQIVNGGQTTASLAHFLRNNKTVDISDVGIQMKLVKVTNDDSAKIVQAIAKYANSQNKVSGADLFATHEIHIRLEQISRRVKAPSKEGEQYQSGWYYERARGQWENDRTARGVASEQKKFDLEFPKSQRLTKTDWAKYAYCWSKKPHLVSKGAQSVFADYAVAVDTQWEKDNAPFNENYFKTNVGKAILFRSLNSSVLKSHWYKAQGGYLANIVAYTISRYSLAIEEQYPQAKFDFIKIWNKQAIPTFVMEDLLAIAENVRSSLTDPSNPQANVTQWAKQSACWEKMKKISVALNPLTSTALISTEDNQRYERDARNIQIVDDGFAKIARVLAVKKPIWELIAGSSRNMNLSPTERELVEKVGITKSVHVPTERQAAAIIRMLERLASEGFINREDF
jgi:hypothetical protein